MEWKIGDIAICIKVGALNSKNLNPPPLRLKGEYVVNGIRTCGCGHLTLDVGITSSTQIINCGMCPRVTHNEPIWWCSASRFVKKDEKSIEEQIAEAVGNEDYELAEKLKNTK